MELARTSRTSAYDKLATDYIAAVDLQSQRAAAKKIQELLLDEVPIIFAYFYYYLSATKPAIAGVERGGDGPHRRIAGGHEGLTAGRTQGSPWPASSQSASSSA